MDVRMWCADAIRRTGGAAVLYKTDADPQGFVACIQPAGAQVEDTATPAGWIDTQKYTLYAPHGTAADRMEVGDTVGYAERRFVVRDVQEVFFGGRAVYRRALLQPEGGVE